MSLARSESDIVREIGDYLTRCDLFFWRANNFPVSGRAMPKYSARGVPDILILWRGVFIGMEVKRPKSDLREPNGRRVRQGNISAYQDAFGARIIFNDGEYFVVRSVQEAEHALAKVAIKKAFNIPKPDHAKS